MLNELLNKLDHYLIEQCSLQELQTWLLTNLQDILASNDKKAIEVANNVDADIVEFHENLIDEVTLRERSESYIRLIETIRINFPETEATSTVRVGVDDKTFRKRWEEPTQVESLHLDLVFA